MGDRVASLTEEMRDPLGIDLDLDRIEEVPAAAFDDRRRTERPPQPSDVPLQRLAGRRRRLLGPHCCLQYVDPHSFADSRGQGGQQCPLDGSEADGCGAVDQLHRSEDSNLHTADRIPGPRTPTESFASKHYVTAGDRPPFDSRLTTARAEPATRRRTTAVTTEEQTTMKHTTKTVTSIAALIGATLVIAAPTPADATGPTRLDVCLAIDDEPLCDLVRPTSTGGGGGTEPSRPPHGGPHRRPRPDACRSATFRPAPRSGRPSHPG